MSILDKEIRGIGRELNRLRKIRTTGMYFLNFVLIRDRIDFWEKSLWELLRKL